VTYIFTRQAARDLAAITHYTMRQWGEKQADRYILALETGIENAVAGRSRLKKSR